MSKTDLQNHSFLDKLAEVMVLTFGQAELPPDYGKGKREMYHERQRLREQKMMPVFEILEES
jgi:hypothetical protein